MLAVAPAASPGPATAACGVAYCVVDLGGPAPSFAAAIDNAGTIVGQAGGHAYLWRNGAAIDLGTLPPAPNEDVSESVAYAIDDRGEVVGASGGFEPGPNDGLSFSGAFVYAGSMRAMTPPKQQGSWVEVTEGQQAFGINDAGTIVGVDQFRGFVFRDGVKSDVPPLSTRRVWNGTLAVGVNDRGTIVGATTIGSGPADTLPDVHAFAWNAALSGSMTDLGTLRGYRDSIAIAVNRNGEVVGYASRGGTDGVDEDIADWGAERDPQTLEFQDLPADGHAFSWKGGTMHDLGGTAALAIDAAGTIVGYSGDRAVMWRAGRRIDANALLPAHSGWVLRRATGVNDRGWIVGWGIHAGQRRAFLLTPKRP